jgi:polysaccharide biosynthesis/export protein
LGLPLGYVGGAPVIVVIRTSLDIGSRSMTRLSRFQGSALSWLVLAVALTFGLYSQPNRAADVTPTPGASATTADASVPLGRGDSITVNVFGQPDMDGTVSIADDGTIRLPLIGSQQVAGLSTAQAAINIEKALKDGGFLIKPHVSVTLATAVSQLVSILGEVRTPGRYQVNSHSTIFQILALAGGLTPDGADTIFLIHTDASGKQERQPIDLKGFNNSSSALPTAIFKGGDSIFVPRADKFYIYGEVSKPDSYKLEPGMTVIQAIARAGGLTPRGSDRRVEIKRTGPDGHQNTFGAKQDAPVKPDDVIRVKESIF